MLDDEDNEEEEAEDSDVCLIWFQAQVLQVIIVKMPNTLIILLTLMSCMFAVQYFSQYIDEKTFC